ncbi:MAG: hypothetical protein AAGI68_08805 [Planctomycetota bacterium]
MAGQEKTELANISESALPGINAFTSDIEAGRLSRLFFDFLKILARTRHVTRYSRGCQCRFSDPECLLAPSSRGTKIMKKLGYAAATAALLFGAPTNAQLSITVGNIELLPDTPNQAVEIFVTGGQQVEVLNFNSEERGSE